MSDIQEKILVFLNGDRLGFCYTQWIADKIGFDYEEVGKSLQSLMAENLVEVIHTDPDPCWHISKSGIKLMNKRSSQ